MIRLSDSWMDLLCNRPNQTAQTFKQTAQANAGTPKLGIQTARAMVLFTDYLTGDDFEASGASNKEADAV